MAISLSRWQISLLSIITSVNDIDGRANVLGLIASYGITGADTGSNAGALSNANIIWRAATNVGYSRVGIAAAQAADN